MTRSDPPERKTSWIFQFDMREMFYAVTLLAASLSLFGPLIGIFMAIIILILWSAILPKLKQRFGGPPRHDTREAKRAVMSRADIIGVLVIVGILIALLLPAVQSVSSSTTSCFADFENLSKALGMYHLNHGSLPPAFVADADGRPMHSWRVLILPELGYQALFDRYHFDEPWDGPRNRKLLEEMPQEYQCYQSGPFEPGTTSYLAVIGPHTAWPGETPYAKSQWNQGGEMSILLVEAEFQPVPWTQPSDLAFDDASKLLEAPKSTDYGHWDKGFFSSNFIGRRALMTNFFSDRTIEWIPPSETIPLDELLTLDDGKPSRPFDELTEQWRSSFGQHVEVIHYTNIARLILFLIVALWPGIWVVVSSLRKRQQTRSLRSIERIGKVA